MIKADYQINCDDRRARGWDLRRWSAARSRKHRFGTVYDLRLDASHVKTLLRSVKKPTLRDAIRSIPHLDAWEHLAESGVTKGEFVGYVRRLLLHGKGLPYFLELKDVQAKTYDHELGWLGFHVREANAAPHGQGFRYPYQPYIPGRVVRVIYLRFEEGSYLDGQVVKVPLQIDVELGFDRPIGA